MLDLPSTTTNAAVSTAVRGLPLLQKTVVLGTSAAFLFTLFAERYYLRLFGRAIRKVRTEDDTRVTMSLFANFKQIALIALPTWRCREAYGTVLFILLFAVKAVLRVWVSKTNADVLSTMLHGTPGERLYHFVQKIIMRAAVSMANGMCSGAIEGIRPWLIGCYRERLSRTFQRRYYQHLVYYQASVLDNRLEAADTVIATYCGEFAEHFAELPYYFLLPGFGIITSTSALVKQAGARVASVMGLIVTTSVLVLRRLSPQFGRIHAVMLSREDDYRRMLGGAMNSVESIAMHGAGDYTRHQLDNSLAKLKRTLDHMALAKGNFETLEIAFTSFLTICANIITFDSAQSKGFSQTVSDVYMEIQLIEDLNASVKDFVVNFRELSHLTEFSTKMAEFDSTLKSIAAGTFIHELGVKADAEGKPVGTPLTYTNISFKEHTPGDIHTCELIAMSDVQLKSPAGSVLIEHMTLSFFGNEDWVILGENGCGKTSLLRMLTGLWLPTSGTLTMDKSVQFLMAPQHSYMAPQCTLYEQICFPQRPPNPTDEIKDKVKEAIRLSGAHTVVDVIGGYESRIMGFQLNEADDTYDWTSLSGGQKQRISMARVFFHVLTMDRTKVTPVAILDEATSMMDDTEQEVLNNIRRLDIRMISVTHRDVVIRHHTNILKFGRNGAWHTEKVAHRVRIDEAIADAAEETV